MQVIDKNKIKVNKGKTLDLNEKGIFLIQSF